MDDASADVEASAIAADDANTADDVAAGHRMLLQPASPSVVE